jgi:hypothetical protein
MSACGVLVLADMLADLIENSPQHGSGFDIDHWKRPPKNQDVDLRKSFLCLLERHHAIMARSLSTGVLITVKSRAYGL